MFTRRLNRIFRPDGRTLIVALDHGLTEGAVKGLENPGELLKTLAESGADALLTSYGIARRFAQETSPMGLILRLDVGGTKLGKMGPGVQFFRSEDALRLGADAVAVTAFPGTPDERDTLQNLARAITEAQAWGLPVMGEMQPGGFDAGPQYFTTENIAICARIAAELGANWVKAPYADEFERVVQACYVPVVMLGGVKVDNEYLLYENVWKAIQAGGAGIAIGRNIFQAKKPGALVKALAAIIHRGASVEEAGMIYEQMPATPNS